jgi:hypothetical protein
MPAAAVYTASLPTAIWIPPTPQSPIPRISSASLQTIRSTSPGPSWSVTKAFSIWSGWSIDKKMPRGRRYSWEYFSIASPTVGS